MNITQSKYLVLCRRKTRLRIDNHILQQSWLFTIGIQVKSWYQFHASIRTITIQTNHLTAPLKKKD